MQRLNQYQTTTPHENQPKKVDPLGQLHFPAPADFLNANQRLHWAPKARLVKAWRTAAYVHARRAKLPAFDGKVRLVVQVHRPRAGRYDPNNFNPTGKAIVDGLTDYGCWPDDDSKHVVGPDMREGEKGPEGVTLLFYRAKTLPHFFIVD